MTVPYDERIRIEPDRAREMNVTKCILCRNCDIAVTGGTTAVVACLKRGTILMNCRVAYCRFFEAMEALGTEDPTQMSGLLEKEIKKAKKSKEESNG